MPADATTHRMRYTPLTVLLALSLLIHVVLLILIALYTDRRESPKVESSPVIAISLKASVPAPRPPPKVTSPAPESSTQKMKQAERRPAQIAHLPRHNAEKTDLNGTSFDAPVTDKRVKRPKPAEKPAVDKENNKTQLAESRSKRPEALKKPEATQAKPIKKEAIKNTDQPAKSVTTTASVKPVIRSANEAPKRIEKLRPATSPSVRMTRRGNEHLSGNDTPPGMTAMSDKELAGEKVGDPFSAIEARRIRMVNLYIERMQKQVKAHFRLTANMTAYREGVVVFELDSSGYLEFSHLDRSSGNSLLDAAALEAVRAVPRFDVPESEVIAARYYRNLRFRFTSDEQ